METLLVPLLIVVGLVTLVGEWFLASWVADDLFKMLGLWDVVVKIVLFLFLGNVVKVFSQGAIAAWGPKR